MGRGQYSDAVLNELESQNDGQVEGIMGKVRQLKDVCCPFHDYLELCSWMADDNSDWRRDSRQFSVGGEDE